MHRLINKLNMWTRSASVSERWEGLQEFGRGPPVWAVVTRLGESRRATEAMTPAGAAKGPSATKWSLRLYDSVLTDAFTPAWVGD